MEAATLPAEQKAEQDGAPVEQGAEATRSSAQLFAYSKFVHAGAGWEDCPHQEDGRCKEVGHFHAVVCLPNSLQQEDIQAKAKAAKARHKRALRDAGRDGQPASDAYVTLESELDDLLGPGSDRKRVLREIAERETRKNFGEHVISVREEERFSDYEQNAEEYKRLARIPEESRPSEEFEQLDREMTEFANAIEERVEAERKSRIETLGELSDESLREVVRLARIEGESEERSVSVYYTWLGFVGTRVANPDKLPSAKRYFQTLEDFRAAPREAIDVIDNAIRDLETRLARGGDASGN